MFRRVWIAPAVFLLVASCSGTADPVAAADSAAEAESCAQLAATYLALEQSVLDVMGEMGTDDVISTEVAEAMRRFDRESAATRVRIDELDDCSGEELTRLVCDRADELVSHGPAGDWHMGGAIPPC